MSYSPTPVPPSRAQAAPRRALLLGGVALLLGAAGMGQAQAQPRHGDPRHDGPRHGGPRHGPGPGGRHHPPPPPPPRHHGRPRRGSGPHHSWHHGDRVPRQYRSPHYVVNDWRRHRLSPPPRGYHWVQYGGDYLLVAIATGVITQMILSGY